MALNNTCVACGAQFNSQQSSRCLRCILKNCNATNISLTSRVERSDQKPRSVARPPSISTDQRLLPQNNVTTANKGTSKAFLAWQAKQSQRFLVSQPKPPPTPHRERFPTGLSPWRAPRIVSMPVPLSAVCVLCGCRVPDMLQHKYAAHGEEPVVRAPTTPRKDRSWLTFVSGGLPSLGKRSK